MAKKILVVEDETNITKIITSRLNASGYDVICAYDGEQALYKLTIEKPDLIILDIMLPVLSGYEVCYKIRKDETYKDYSSIPIIMLTAKSELDDMKTGLDRGADAYITKPFKAETLISVIKSLLGE
ncbi:MAG: response regulator [Candidatus Aenigmatarchaeota archaeon]